MRPGGTLRARAPAQRVALTAGPLPALAAAALYAALMAAWYPYRDVFAFDPDEGINAIKALLLDHGYALYTDIWEDQPPLGNHVLQRWFAAFGATVDSGRILMLLFAAAAIFALYDILRRESGHTAAVVACLLLASSAYFARLSLSLMFGLPAVAVALLALWALCRWRHDGGAVWIATAGALMGAALGLKLFTGMLVPVFAVWLVLVTPRAPDGGSRWGVVASWLGCTAAATALWLVVLVGPAHFAMLIGSHVAARSAPLMARYGPLGLLITGWAEWPLTVLGVGACALLLWWRRWSVAVFPLWSAVALGCLLLQRPYWYHYQLLLSVPYSAAAGLAVAELLGRQAVALPGGALRPLRWAAVVLIAVQVVWTVTSSHRLPQVAPIDGPRSRLMEVLRERGTGERRMMTSDPMYAFRAGYEVPPALANLCLKRIAGDERLADEVRRAFAQQPPALVLITAGTSSTLTEWTHQAMGNRYRLLSAEDGTELYAR